MKFVKGPQVEYKVLALLVTPHWDLPPFLQVAFSIYIKEITNMFI